MTRIHSQSGSPSSDSHASTAIRASWRFDVSETIDLPGRFEIAADLVAPSVPLPASDSSVTPILCCLPGGFLSKRYFDLGGHGPGEREERDLGYSFAEAMSQQGFITIAFDHLGVGESSKPDPPELGLEIDVETIARANQRALELVLQRLSKGDAELGLAPIVNPVTLGVGHSMGSMLTVEQQALARPHRALLLFSFSTRGTPAFLDDEMRAYTDQPERTRREIGELARRSMGGPYPARAENSEGDRRAAFGVGTAPASAEEALHSAATNLLAVGGLMSMIPGGYAPPALEIDVPVFMWVGDHDLHDDRHTRAELPRSPDVRTRTLADCWHCHFVANTRETIWKISGEWIREVLAS